MRFFEDKWKKENTQTHLLHKTERSKEKEGQGFKEPGAVESAIHFWFHPTINWIAGYHSHNS